MKTFADFYKFEGNRYRERFDKLANEYQLYVWRHIRKVRGEGYTEGYHEGESAAIRGLRAPLISRRYDPYLEPGPSMKELRDRADARAEGYKVGCKVSKDGHRNYVNTLKSDLKEARSAANKSFAKSQRQGWNDGYNARRAAMKTLREEIVKLKASKTILTEKLINPPTHETETRAYNKGYMEGSDKGLAEGRVKRHSHSQSFANGRAQGHAEGYNKGLKKWKAHPNLAVLKVSYDDGFEDGKKTRTYPEIGRSDVDTAEFKRLKVIEKRSNGEYHTGYKAGEAQGKRESYGDARESGYNAGLKGARQAAINARKEGYRAGYDERNVECLKIEHAARHCAMTWLDGNKETQSHAIISLRKELDISDDDVRGYHGKAPLFTSRFLRD